MATVSARFSPSADTTLICAVPLPVITLRTSAKSTFTRSLFTVIISAIPLAAEQRISSAFPKASASERFLYCLMILSLLIISRESTCSRRFLIPSTACEKRSLPSTDSGEVTIATVRIPCSLAIFAITGEAPVPVPPPIPAVIKSILVFEATS